MTNSCNSCSSTVDQNGCPSDRDPDFIIRRHDTKPPFEISVKDCDGPIDLTDTVLEVSMWANGKFRTALSKTDTCVKLADNIGFNQVLIGDIIVVEQIRSPEQMLVTGFDEFNDVIRVQRGYNGSPAQQWKKGQSIKIFRVLNGIGETEMVYMDIEQVDGTTKEDVLVDSKLIYNWQSEDTCVPGCFWLELKLLKMQNASLCPTGNFYFLESEPSLIPSFTSYTENCNLGDCVEWVKRYPTGCEAFLIQIIDSPTSESLV